MESSRYPKRRRVSSPVKDKVPRFNSPVKDKASHFTSPVKDKAPVRFSSPDELAASSDHGQQYYAQKHPPHSSRDNVERGRRYSAAATSRESPDELDHTVDHTVHHFYRGSFSKSKCVRQSHEKSTSRSPPPYSPISAAVATPSPPRTPPQPLTPSPPRTPLRRRTPSPPAVRPPQYVPYKQRMVLKGHRKGVAAVAFSPDGRLIASCCESAQRFSPLSSN